MSVATVSRVLNQSRPVDPVLQERVQAAAERLGYRPSGAARALRLQVTNMISVVVADIENPFFTSLVRGVEDEALASGYGVLLCDTDDDLEREAQYLRVAAVERVAGVVAALSGPVDSLAPLDDAGIPLVAVDRVPPGSDGIDSVTADNRLGGRLAAERLLASGCRRLACITGPAGVVTADERAAGFVEVAGDAVVHRADFRAAGAEQVTDELLAGGDRPDGLFVTNNLMTVGTVTALRRAGLRIPTDVQLVGFDDFPAAPLMDPPLTVIAQPAREMGRLAAELLLGRTVEPDRPARHDVLAPVLVERASTR